MSTTTKKKPTAAIKPCNCVKLVNDAIAKDNLELDTRLGLDFATKKFSLSFGLPLRKLDSSKRSKMPFIACTYCPVCGKKLH